MDTTNATGWIDVGTPVVANSTAQSPFRGWKNADQCKLIIDDDNAAFEGKQGDGGIDAGWYTASCYLAAGDGGTTVDKARIDWVTDGNVDGGGCNFSGLTSTVSRQTCTRLITGTSSSVRPTLVVGNAASDTGSISVCQCQMDEGVFAEQPTPYNRAFSASIYWDGGAFPDGTANGAYEVVYQAPYRIPEDWFSGADTLYLFDAFNDRDAGGAGSGTTHSSVIIHGYATPSISLVRTQNGFTDITQFTPDSGVALNTRYAARVEWRTVGGGRCKVWYKANSCSTASPVSSCTATTTVASDVSGSAFCPSRSYLARLCDRYDNTFPSNCFIEAARTYQ
jgi:hypothetical protein